MSGTCGFGWPNTELPDLPHRCVIRIGWHVRHACHCGQTRRVEDTERIDIRGFDESHASGEADR